MSPEEDRWWWLSWRSPKKGGGWLRKVSGCEVAGKRLVVVEVDWGRWVVVEVAAMDEARRKISPARWIWSGFFLFYKKWKSVCFFIYIFDKNTPLVLKIGKIWTVESIIDGWWRCILLIFDKFEISVDLNSRATSFFFLFQFFWQQN